MPGFFFHFNQKISINRIWRNSLKLASQKTIAAIPTPIRAINLHWRFGPLARNAKQKAANSSHMMHNAKIVSYLGALTKLKIIPRIKANAPSEAIRALFIVKCSFQWKMWS